MKFFLLLFFVSINSFAGTATIPNSFSAGQPAVAADVNENFDYLANFINGANISSENVTAGGIVGSNIATETISDSKMIDNTLLERSVATGALTILSMATTSGPYVYNYRNGCRLSSGGSTTVASVHLPCELVVNGNRASLSATQNISVITDAIDSAPVTDGYDYVYATVAGGVITFKVSDVGPSTTTKFKATDSIYRYIGSMRTASASTNLIAFVSKNPWEYQFSNVGSYLGVAGDQLPTKAFAITVDGSEHLQQVAIPGHARYLIADIEAIDTSFQPVQLFTASWMDTFYGNTSYNYYRRKIPLISNQFYYTASGSGTATLTIHVKGYEEPSELYQ